MPSVLPSTRSEEKLGTREIAIYIVLSYHSITRSVKPSQLLAQTIAK